MTGSGAEGGLGVDDRTYSESPGTLQGGAPLLAVVIGASAGGPGQVQMLLEQLPADFPVPIAVCQHMTAGATAPWAERLNECTPLRVVEAAPGDRFEAGTVYIAPTGKHMRLLGPARKPHISLLPDFADALHVPSIDFLMSSAADVFGSRVLGVILTGLGSDGALGMLAIRRAGGPTICERPETAPFASMPRAAAELGAASQLIDLDDMAAAIMDRVVGRV